MKTFDLRALTLSSWPGCERRFIVGGKRINCGTFSGEDKSGSPLFEVLKELPDAPAEVVGAIRGAFKSQDFALIPESDARLLLPALMAYRTHLTSEIGHDDWRREAIAEIKAGMDASKAREGGSRGWRLACTDDLIAACNTSLLEHQLVIIMPG